MWKIIFENFIFLFFRFPILFSFCIFPFLVFTFHTFLKYLTLTFLKFQTFHKFLKYLTLGNLTLTFDLGIPDIPQIPEIFDLGKFDLGIPDIPHIPEIFDLGKFDLGIPDIPHIPEIFDLGIFAHFFQVVVSAHFVPIPPFPILLAQVVRKAEACTFIQWISHYQLIAIDSLDRVVCSFNNWYIYTVVTRSSIGDGGFDASCAKTPTRKKCAKTTTQKKTGLTGNPKVKSQGQIFQEC